MRITAIIAIAAITMSPISANSASAQIHRQQVSKLKQARGTGVARPNTNAWFVGKYCIAGGKYVMVLARSGYYFYTGGKAGTWTKDGENGFIATFPSGMTRRGTLRQNAGGGYTLNADDGGAYYAVRC
jgi:hypothetical protein